MLSQMILVLLFFSFVAYHLIIPFSFATVKTLILKEYLTNRISQSFNRVSDYMEICEILPCFHALTGSDYTNPFFQRTKVQSFTWMVVVPSSVSLFSSIKLEDVDIPAAIKFILQIIYNRPTSRFIFVNKMTHTSEPALPPKCH